MAQHLELHRRVLFAVARTWSTCSLIATVTQEFVEGGDRNRYARPGAQTVIMYPFSQ
jgi:hypothetical protein